VKPTEAAALLTIAAAFDNRKPDADQAKAWAMALDGLRFEDCREVIIEHYRNSREWLMPVEVVAGVRRMRDRRIAALSIDIPPGFDPDDTAAYARLLAESRRRAGDGEVVERPELAPVPEQVERVKELLSDAFHGVDDDA